MKNLLTIPVQLQNARCSQLSMATLLLFPLTCGVSVCLQRAAASTVGMGSKPLSPIAYALHTTLWESWEQNITLGPQPPVWFSDSVVWIQCAHGGRHTWNFDLVSSQNSPLRQCWAHVILRAKDDTALLNDDVHWHSNGWQFFWCVMKAYICSHMCAYVHICWSQRLPAMFLCCSPPWFWYKFLTEPGVCCFSDSPACPHCQLKLQGHTTMKSSYVGNEDSNSSLHAGTASLYTPQPPPQSSFH